MLRHNLSSRPAITILLLVQIIPLILFPLSLFTMDNQDWWLPVLLAVMTLVGFVELAIRHSQTAWPWFLISFAQGFNIISRLMMVMPHATINSDGAQVFNTSYVVITVISILLSTFFLWYTDWPEVRKGLF